MPDFSHIMAMSLFVYWLQGLHLCCESESVVGTACTGALTQRLLPEPAIFCVVAVPRDRCDSKQACDFCICAAPSGSSGVLLRGEEERRRGGEGRRSDATQIELDMETAHAVG